MISERNFANLLVSNSAHKLFYTVKVKHPKISTFLNEVGGFKPEGQKTNPKILQTSLICSDAGLN